MSDKIINPRGQVILQKIEHGKKYALSELAALFPNEMRPSLATLRRDLAELCSLGFLEQLGKLKSTRYVLTPWGVINNPIDASEYFEIDVDSRNGNGQYNFSIFTELPSELFPKATIATLDEATQDFENRSKSASPIILKKELERFVIELSWKSSKIEGNTYTLLDTELLLKEGIEASGHPKKEAVMILNHKKAFQYILTQKEKYKNPTIRMIEDVHRLLVEGLDVSFGLRKNRVGVTGSKYIPLGIPTQIQEALTELCAAIERMQDPYAKALLTLVGISYIQPFEDGNKRTARLCANAILLAHYRAPLSYRNVDEIRYRQNMLVFYEKNSIVPMRDIFIEQYIFSCKNYLLG